MSSIALGDRSIRLSLNVEAFRKAFEGIGKALAALDAACGAALYPPRCYGPPPLSINGHAYHRRLRSRRGRR